MKFNATDIILVHREIEVPDKCPHCGFDFKTDDERRLVVHSYVEQEWEASLDPNDGEIMKAGHLNRDPQDGDDLGREFNGGSELLCDNCGDYLADHKIIEINDEEDSENANQQRLEGIKLLREGLFETEEG